MSSIDEPLEIEMMLDFPPLLFIPKNYYASWRYFCFFFSRSLTN